MNAINTKQVKEFVLQKGADLVGIASADTLNENPPDPRWPQTVSRLWPECRSVIVIAKRMPWGVYRSHDRVNRMATPDRVMRILDRVAIDLTYYLEDHGAHALPHAYNVMDTDLKYGTYGPLSSRHVAVEAGLGTLGLNMMLLTPQYGPRVYLDMVLTTADLEPNRRLQERLCPGPSCGRCLCACPPDAVKHWGLNKKLCAQCAQVYGFPTLLTHIENLIAAETEQERHRLLWSVESLNLGQMLTQRLGAYAGCLRCVEVCPVGDDYQTRLKDSHAKIPEDTQEKRARLKKMLEAERNGQEIEGETISMRWIGEKHRSKRG